MVPTCGRELCIPIGGLEVRNFRGHEGGKHHCLFTGRTKSSIVGDHFDAILIRQLSQHCKGCQAGKALHAFIVSVLYLEYHHTVDIWGSQGPPLPSLKPAYGSPRLELQYPLIYPCITMQKVNEGELCVNFSLEALHTSNKANIQQVGIDLIGPFPKTKSGMYNYTITAVDYFSKWLD